MIDDVVKKVLADLQSATPDAVWDPGEIDQATQTFRETLLNQHGVNTRSHEELRGLVVGYTLAASHISSWVRQPPRCEAAVHAWIDHFAPVLGVAAAMMRTMVEFDDLA